MKLTRISALNFKGLSFDYDLAPVNVVVGNNFTGKTAIQDAIRVALTGYHTRLGKTNASTYALAGVGLMMQVRADFAPTGSVLHTWTKDAKGAVKYVGEIPPELRIPPVLLDPQVYFGLTAEQKVQMVFREIPLDDFDWEEVLAKLDELKVDGGVQWNEQVRSMVVKSDGNAPKPSVQSLMDSAIEALKGAQKESKILYKQALDQSGAANKNKPLLRAKAVDKAPEILLANEKRLKIQTQVAMITQSQATESVATARRKYLEGATAGVDLKKLQAEALVAHESNEAKFKELNAFRDESPEIERLLKEAQAKVALLAIRRFDIKNEAEKIKLREQELKAEQPCSNLACPHQARVNLELENVSVAIQALRVSFGITKAEWHAAYHDVEVLQKQLQDKRKLLDEQASKYTAIEAQAKRNSEQNKKLVVLQSYVDELSGLKALDPVDASKLPELTKELAEADAGLAKLHAEQAIYTSWISWKTQADKTEAQAVAQAKRLEAIEGMLGVLQTKQEEVATEAFNVLLAKSDMFTSGILLSALEYRNGELGRTSAEGAWIPHETFSGTEKLLAYAGLCVALSQSSPMKVVLMDELGVLDRVNKKKLIGRMVELADKGEIDLFVGIDVVSTGYDGTGVKLITL